MSQLNVLAQTISDINPRFFRFFHLREFNHPDYNPIGEIKKEADKTNQMASKGLQFLLRLINYSKFQLADFRDNFLKGTRTDYISRKAGEIHQLIDEIENLEERLKRESIPIVRSLLNTQLAQRGMERLFQGGHDLTSLAESCTVHVLESLSEFDLRKSARDYFLFVENKVEQKVEEFSFNYVLPKKISWEEFEQYLNSGFCPNYLLLSLPPKQLLVLNRIYGLDKKPAESREELATRLENPLKIIKILERAALTKLGIATDPIGFRDKFYSGKSRKEIERENRALWKYLKDNDSLFPSQRRDYERNPIAIYKEKYEGVSRGKLPYIDDPLYQALKYHKQLHLVPASRVDIVKAEMNR